MRPCLPMGHRVLLAEMSSSPKEKICGEFVCPQAFEILEAIGARPALEAELHSEISGMILSSPNGMKIETQFPEFLGKKGHRSNGIAMHRRRFDGVLQQNARSQGADFRAIINSADLNGSSFREVHPRA